MNLFPFFNGSNAAAEATTARSIIALQGVTKSYQTAAGDYMVLKGIDLAFDAGEFVSVVGCVFIMVLLISKFFLNYGTKFVIGGT